MNNIIAIYLHYDDAYSLIFKTFSSNYKNNCINKLSEEIKNIDNNHNLTEEEKVKRKKNTLCYRYFMLVIDQISGMTDSYAYDMYLLFNGLKL